MNPHFNHWRRFIGASVFVVCLVAWDQVPAAELETKPDDPFFANLEPVQAPAPAGLLLQTGDRLAIIGDSITEQKRYSRILETYLTVCVPELKGDGAAIGLERRNGGGLLGEGDK